MRMDLIQPFINAADAVFAESLQGPTKIGDLSMEEGTYRRKGIAAVIAIKGDIEGRIILDLAPEVARKVAAILAGSEAADDQSARETVCELANMVMGYTFKVFPPEIHTSDEGLKGSADTEAMVLAIETSCGSIFLNIAMHHLARRRRERDLAPLSR